LLIRSALLVSHVDPGFDTSNVVVGRVGLPDAGYHDPVVARQTFERMITGAASLPGVESAAVVSRAPLAGGGSSNGLLAEGKALDLANLVNSQLQIISPSYLSTARVPLKAGRDSTRHARAHFCRHRQRNSRAHDVAWRKPPGQALCMLRVRAEGPNGSGMARGCWCGG
jgi:hypothetical protein